MKISSYGYIAAEKVDVKRCETFAFKYSIPRLRLRTFIISNLRNRLANQSQILCGAYMGRGNESLLTPSGSNDQDGRHAHIW